MLDDVAQFALTFAKRFANQVKFAKKSPVRFAVREVGAPRRFGSVSGSRTDRPPLLRFGSRFANGPPTAYIHHFGTRGGRGARYARDNLIHVLARGMQKNVHGTYVG